MTYHPAQICGLWDAMIKTHLQELVEHYTHIHATSKEEPSIPFILKVMDPLVGVVILFNGLTIGISSDVDWQGWLPLEIFFAVFFVIEILIKLRYAGCYVTSYSNDSFIPIRSILRDVM